MKLNKTKSETKRSIWIAVGAAVLAIILFNLILQGIAQNRAKGLVTALQMIMPESTQVSPDALPAEDPTTVTINDMPVCGELLVPVLHVDTALIEENSSNNLKKSPCLVSGSASGRDLVIAGGNYRSHLGKINTLIKGDTVMYCDMDGHLYLYDVETVDYADRDNVLEVSDGGYDLSLFCVAANGSVKYAARCTLCEPIE